MRASDGTASVTPCRSDATRAAVLTRARRRGQLCCGYGRPRNPINGRSTIVWRFPSASEYVEKGVLCRRRRRGRVDPQLSHALLDRRDQWRRDAEGAEPRREQGREELVAP